jgi:peptidoglycan/xylan/chitin deacetylase (PgdA/CDA1 family)
MRATGGGRGAVVAAVIVLAGCGGSTSPRSSAKEPAQRTPAPRVDVASVAARADVPVLCYHQIRAPTARDGAAARPYIVAPAVLEKQMQALDDAGFHTVTGDELVAHVARGARLPSKPVLLTFDDASAGQFTAALPILRRHRFVATFFVMTVVLDKPGWLTRRQVRELDRAGMTIGAHTWDHSAVPDYAGADWQRQIDEPTRTLTRLVGHPVRLFAYPFGLWDPGAIPHLWDAGLRAAFQLGERFDRRHPLWNIRRIIVPSWSGRELLRGIRRSF